MNVKNGGLHNATIKNKHKTFVFNTLSAIIGPDLNKELNYEQLSYSKVDKNPAELKSNFKKGVLLANVESVQNCKIFG